MRAMTSLAPAALLRSGRLAIDPLRLRRLRRAMLGAAVVVALVIPVVRAFWGLWPDAVDAHAYWAARIDQLYRVAQVGATDAYLYSPAFAQVLAPISGVLPFSIFLGLWTALLLAALVVMAGPWTIPLLLLTPALNEVILGNVHLLIGLVAAFGFRWPGLWSFVLLTKVTPGVGLVWFAVRREWRALGIALGVTAAIVLVSLAAAPRLWSEWLGVLQASRGAESPYAILDLPIWLRMVLAALLVAWGARRNRRWTVPVGAWLALPISWFAGLAVLVGVIPLLQGSDRRPLPSAVPQTQPAR